MDNRKYEDMLDLPHHVSPTRPPMPLRDRAAQFAPFAALTGHSDAIRETARLTDPRADLDDSQRAALDHRLQIILHRLDENPEVTITWFQPDEKKAGGAYRQTTGHIKKVDPYRLTLLLADQTLIPIDQIYHIESAVLQNDCLF